MNHAEEPSRGWDHDSDTRFTDYYLEQSASEAMQSRVRAMRDAMRRVLSHSGGPEKTLDVLDIGCNAGALCMAWAELGHRVHGLDVNAPLLEAARKRTADAGRDVDYRLGSAVDLPWDDASMDVTSALELLEHVEDWQAVVREMMRVTRPGGMICLTTTNVRCPVQNEFNLPLYSWYPPSLKRRYVRLAMSTRPELANYARYPAFHWFSYGQLSRFARAHGFRSFDRYQVADPHGKGLLKGFALRALKALPPLRFVASFADTGTMFFAVRER